MSRIEKLMLFLLIFMYSEFTQAQIGRDRNGDDSSLSNFDIVCMNNSGIDESLLQHMVNWDEIPIDLKGIKRIVEVTGYSWLPDSVSYSDTTIIDGTNQSINVNGNTQFILEYDLKDDSTIVTSYINSVNETHGLIQQTFNESKSQSIYINSRLKEQKGEFMADFKYEYYPSGNLKQINMDSARFISSTQNEDTIVYQTHNDYFIDMNIISNADDLPSHQIKMFMTENDSCYCYQNYITWKPLSIEHQINKEITQCKDGRILNIKRWNKYDNYNTVIENYDFIYDDTILISKVSNIETPNGKRKEFYIYNNSGLLIERKDGHKGRKYIYDERNNVIKMIDYWLESKEISDIVIRYIEYIK